MHRALRDFGVDDRCVSAVSHLPTPVVFCEIFPPDDFPLYFYRLPTAPDLEIQGDELDLDAIAAADIFWVTVTGLSRSPSREAHLAALAARGRSGLTVLDLDYRPMFWDSAAEAAAAVRAALAHVDVAVGNLEECEVAVGESDPQAAAKALLEAGVELAVVKQGPAGVLGGRRHADGRRVVVPPVPVEVVNGLGAGDAFGGALVPRAARGPRPAHASCASPTRPARSSPGQLACADAMPTTAELDDHAPAERRERTR